jgi:hypothetical protein
MTGTAKTQMLRKCMVLIFLALGVLLVVDGKATKVGATSCDDAFTAYANADNAYYNAYNSYYFDDPISCITACTGDPNPNCIQDCETTRYTAVGNAEFNMFETSNETCDPIQLDACAEARALATGCLSQFDVSSTSDEVEQYRIANEYSACRTASKVDSCQ